MTPQFGEDEDGDIDDPDTPDIGPMFSSHSKQVVKTNTDGRPSDFGLVSGTSLSFRNLDRTAATMDEKKGVILEGEDSWSMSKNGMESAPSVKSAVSELSVKSALSATNGTAESAKVDEGGMQSSCDILEVDFSEVKST